MLFSKNKGRCVKINRINRLEICEDIAPINKQRQNDSFIMEAFIEAKISTNNLFILNIIRMFLKAVTVSDIATSDGKSISYNAWNLIESNKLREDLDWPRHPPVFTQAQKNL